jgi:hypothetical protein
MNHGAKCSPKPIREKVLVQANQGDGCPGAVW